MLDTVLLRGPYMQEEHAVSIERQLETRMAVENSTGVERYRFVSGSLPGSWASMVAVNVKRTEWVDFEDVRHDRRSRAPQLVEVLPYLTVEGSVHKAIMGHNVYGGPLDPAAGSRWFLADVSERLGVQLPAASLWRYDRLDWAEVFDVGTFDACTKLVEGLENAWYSRRQGGRWKSESIMFSGDTTAFKIYHKGPEFLAHDKKRVGLWSGKSRAEELQALAGRYLRVELTVRARKLTGDFRQTGPFISEIKQKYIEDQFDVVTEYVFKELSKMDYEIVRNAFAVEQRLHTVYGRRLANILVGTWFQLAMPGGPEQVKHRLGKPTFYRHLKFLKEAGCSWLGTDVVIVETGIPEGFSFRRDSPFRLREEAPEVSAAIAPFRDAA